MVTNSELLRSIKRKFSQEFQWRTFPTTITLLRTVDFEGETYYCFFEKSSTFFKTRGFYIMIPKNNKEKLRELKEHLGIPINYSITGSGLVDVKNTIPHITMDYVGEEFKDVYKGYEVSNTNINDVLDVLDFVYSLSGTIHLDPYTERTKIEGDEEFKLSGDPTDYSINVDEFLTSRDKPTLSYRFVLIGEEDGKPRRRSFKYPVLNAMGELEQQRLRFSVERTPKHEEWITTHLSHILAEGGVLYYKDRVYFTIDTSKLKAIQTIHELPIDLELVKQRETSRLIIRSLDKLKELLVEKSKLLRLPISEWEEPYRFETNAKPEIEVEVISEYRTEETKAGGTPFKVFLEKSGIKHIGYIDNLITNYIEGKVTDEYIERHIINADNVFKVKILNEGLRILFLPILGNKSLNSMYKQSTKMTKSFQLLYNSQKIRLHSFGDINGLDKRDLAIRYTLSRAKLEIPNEGYANLDWMEGSLFIKTNVKM